MMTCEAACAAPLTVMLAARSTVTLAPANSGNCPSCMYWRTRVSTDAAAPLGRTDVRAPSLAAFVKTCQV